METQAKKKVAVVTGATSGLGRDAAVALAKEGFHVLATGRDAARGAETVARIEAEGGSGAFVAGDLLTVAGARALAAELRARAPALDLLVNNAGGTFSRTEVTADGFERTFALNVVAPQVLVEELVDALAAAKGRVVNVVTGLLASVKTDLEKISGAGAKAGFGAYVGAKLSLVALTAEQQRRFGGRGVTFVALHPGIVPDTNFGSEGSVLFRKLGPPIARLFGLSSTHEAVAARYVEVARGPVTPATYYFEGKARPTPKLALDPAFSGKVWDRAHAAATR